MLRIGVVTPHRAEGPEAEFPAMAPGRIVTRVARVSTDAAGVRVATSPPTPAVARALTAPRFLDEAVTTLAGSIDVLGYASTSSAYAIGYDDEVALVSRLGRRFGVPVASTCASVVMALRVLGVERVALVEPPWFDDELNELGVAYFRSQGLQVVSSASVDLPPDPRLVDPAAVYQWVAGHLADNAEAVVIGGNGFRTTAVIEPLEAATGWPVLTSNQVLLWILLALAEATFEVNRYGQLFAHKPPPDHENRPTPRQPGQPQ